MKMYKKYTIVSNNHTIVCNITIVYNDNGMLYTIGK